MPPSNISLFISNLRLVNLDQRQDWPDITLQTFDTKDPLQNQKKRLSCVEWSLYRLFELWDKELSRDVSQSRYSHVLSHVLIQDSETATLLPASGTYPISQSASCTLPLSQ
jgi:hypothetical protein